MKRERARGSQLAQGEVPKQTTPNVPFVLLQGTRACIILPPPTCLELLPSNLLLGATTFTVIISYSSIYYYFKHYGIPNFARDFDPTWREGYSELLDRQLDSI